MLSRGVMAQDMRAITVVLMCALGACASTQRPVLYPNAHLQSVGGATAERDIDQCLQLADGSGLPKSNNKVVEHGAQGAAVGAAAGSVGTLVSSGNVGIGAVAGAAGGATAGVLYGAFSDHGNPTYRNFVQHCLQDRGYDVIGWQ
jgi:outer membrane lipoprotein SlyB